MKNVVKNVKKILNVNSTENGSDGMLKVTSGITIIFGTAWTKILRTFSRERGFPREADEVCIKSFCKQPYLQVQYDFD